MKIIKNYVISNGVIGHEKEQGRSILEEDEQTRKIDTLFHRYSK